MADRPIIFSAPMVRAILDGRKTQTRRRLKDPSGSGWYRHPVTGAMIGCMGNPPPQVPFAPGDRLWVRETWQEFFADELPPGRPMPVAGRMGIPARPDRKAIVAYRADGEMPAHPEYGPAVWRPSLHMPRWTSRLTLTVTDVRIERVQDISKADAIAEGLAKRAKDSVPTWKYGMPDRDGMPGTDDDGWQWQDWCVDPRNAFGKLWNSINEYRGYGWSANPWVVAITFTAEQRNIDAEAAP